MKKSSYTLLALLACLLIFGGLISYLPASSATVEEVASTQERFVNEEKGYSIEFPKDWQKQDVPQLDLVLLSPKASAESEAHATMNLVSESVGDTISLDQFYTESVKHLTSQLEGVKIENSGDLTIHGIPSKWVQYNHHMLDSEFRVLQYFLVAQGNVYLMTFSTFEDEFEHFKPTFESIATSFKELNKTETPKK